MDRFINKRLDGRYEISELIGIGGMANVYKARDIVESTDVALKILKEEYLSNQEFVRSFRNESKAIALLSHPNIVKVKDVNFGDRIQYIVMEYIDGITLKEYIERERCVDWKQAVHFTEQVLHALQHAHERGIVHRDVKPQNIMLLQNGTIKVMDFGIARFSRDHAKGISEKAVGSVHYISPEQARGELSDQKSDIYSVGVMLFEMLTGKLPFEAEDPTTVAIMQMQQAARPPRSINPSIPEGLENVVMKAMQKSPDSRYMSAAQMLSDIQEFKKNPSIVFEYKYLNNNSDTKYFDAVSSKEEPVEAVSEQIQERSRTLMILGGVALAFVVVTIIAVFAMLGLGGFFDNVGNTVVGNYIGMEFDQAKAEAKQNGIVLQDAVYEYTDAYEKDLIFWQEKEENETVKEKSTVRVKVSLGIEQIDVPDVVNKTFEEAETALNRLDFVVVKKTEFSDDVPKNYVIKTQPAGKTQQPIGSEIIVVVSSGVEKKETTVPAVVGFTLESALLELEKAILKGDYTEVPSDKPKGEVLTQSVDVNTTVEENTTISLTVSNGKPKEEPQKNLTLTVKLPKDGSGVHSFALLDQYGVEKSSIPSVDVGANINKRLEFKITGAGEQYYTIKVDGQTYVTYLVNFEKGSISENTEYNYSILIPRGERESFFTE